MVRPGGRERLPLWSALGPALVALVMIGRITWAGPGLLPRWTEVLLLVGALLLCVLPFVPRRPADRAARDDT